MINLFKVHIEYIGHVPANSEQFVAPNEINAKKLNRETFSSETKQHVRALGFRIREDFRYSKLKVARMLSKQLNIKLRTVYSWLNEDHEVNH